MGISLSTKPSIIDRVTLYKQAENGAGTMPGHAGKKSSIPIYSPLHSDASAFQCRVGCGACCIALSISSPIPGMPDGKPAGVRCIQLTEDNRCLLFGLPERPAVCVRLRPNPEMCGETAEDALAYLFELEQLTSPTAIAQELP